MIFFVNKKTAYKMRCMDWSSDVCSSDLRQETTPSNAAGDLGRRAFLARAGNTALAGPITTSLIVSASATPAIAGSPYGGEGGGHGPKHKPHHKGKKVKHGGGHRKGRY